MGLLDDINKLISTGKVYKTAFTPKPAKRSGSNARKLRVEAGAEAPVEIKPVKAKPERTKIGARLRAMVLERDGFKCVRCGSDGNSWPLHVDHIIPVAQWGDRPGVNDESNLQTLCSVCNLGKGARSEPAKRERKPDAIVSQLREIVGKKNKTRAAGDLAGKDGE